MESEGSEEVVVEFNEEIVEDNVVIEDSGFSPKALLGKVMVGWDGLSKRKKSLIIIAVTAAIILCLLTLILVPLTSESIISADRTYYIQAEEIEWNYVPLGINGISGEGFSTYEEQFTTQKNNRIGSIYKKASFFGYTDDTFTQRLPHSDQLGLLGPVLRAEVGDTLDIVLANQLPFPISFYISGLHYTSSSDTTVVIPPGGLFTHSFVISETDGPASLDFSSVSYSYYSMVDVVGDFNSGLVGVVVITRQGSAGEDAVPTDIEYEGFLSASIFDENLSYYYEENLENYVITQDDVDSDLFMESNRKYTFNGYLYGNLPPIYVAQGTRVRWYMSSLGEGSHTVLWDGQTLLSDNERVGSLNVAPGTNKIADMVPMYKGTWTIESYGLDAKNGMVTSYIVDDYYTIETAYEPE